MLKYVVFAVTEKGRQVLDRSRAELEQVFAGEKTEFLIVSAAQMEEGILRIRMEPLSKGHGESTTRTVTI